MADARQHVYRCPGPCEASLSTHRAARSAHHPSAYSQANLQKYPPFRGMRIGQLAAGGARLEAQKQVRTVSICGSASDREGSMVLKHVQLGTHRVPTAQCSALNILRESQLVKPQLRCVSRGTSPPILLSGMNVISR